MRPTISGRTRLAAVIGDPVRHSLSPVIFDAAATATGVDLSYVALEVSDADLPAALGGVAALGLVGVNVTMPHKARAAVLVDRSTAVAERLGAVNCVTVDGDELVGDNTDGAGFLAALHHDDVEVVGRHVAVLGAGGAARAICAALTEAGAALVSVHNRTPARAEVAAQLAGPAARVGSDDDLPSADLIVNATPVGMGEDPALPLDPKLLRSGQVIVDAVYHPLRTPLLDAAAACGARPLDGIGMLVGQAAIAFERWFGCPAPVAEMRRAARRHLGDS